MKESSTHNLRQYGTAVAAGLALALVTAGCGAQSAGGAGGAVAGGPVTVRASEFKFEPPTIRVVANKSVRLMLANAGQLEHDVVIEGLAAKDVRASDTQNAGKLAARAQAGKQAWVEFTPTAKGTYDIICTIPGHKDAGMRGRLIVE